MRIFNFKARFMGTDWDKRYFKKAIPEQSISVMAKTELEARRLAEEMGWRGLNPV